MKTALNDRTLWYDGTLETAAGGAAEMILCGFDAAKIVVREENEDVELYNSIEDEPLQSHKEKNDELCREWLIPESLKGRPVHEMIIDRLYEFLKTVPEDKHQNYIARVELELREISDRNLELLFKALVFAVNTFRENGVVWGVGRGSSCASLCLFLLGVHLIDPVRFEIPLEEFFHD
jgi:DNA polymerase III alpha subunit